jgi:integrase
VTRPGSWSRSSPATRPRPEAADRRPLFRCRPAVPGLAARRRRRHPGRADGGRRPVVRDRRDRRRGTGSLKNQVTAVRSLLRFLHQRGRIPGPLDGAAPAAAGWHRPPLTRKIRPGDVAAILASCDRDTHAGRRDYAILILLARLGPRAGEAAAARVGDIDWRSGTILVRGRADATSGSRFRPMPGRRSRTTAGMPGRRPRPAGCCSCTPRPLPAAVIPGGRPCRGPGLPAGRAGAGQRPPAAARRRDRDARARSCIRCNIPPLAWGRCSRGCGVTGRLAGGRAGRGTRRGSGVTGSRLRWMTGCGVQIGWAG